MTGVCMHIQGVTCANCQPALSPPTPPAFTPNETGHLQLLGLLQKSQELYQRGFSDGFKAGAECGRVTQSKMTECSICGALVRKVHGDVEAMFDIAYNEWVHVRCHLQREGEHEVPQETSGD